MIAIVCALPLEAKEFIRLFSLIQKSTTTPFSVYESDEVVLVVTGMGSLRMQCGVATLMGLYDPKTFDMVINMGVCAGSKESFVIGDIVMISSLKGERQRCYPDMIARHPFCEGALLSVETPFAGDIPKDHCVDMEGVAFFQAASLFVSPSRLIVVKIISDYGNPDVVIENSKAYLPKVSDTIKEWIVNAKKLFVRSPLLSEQQEEKLRSIAQEKKLSSYQTHDERKKILSLVYGLGMSFDDAVEKGFDVE